MEHPDFDKSYIDCKKLFLACRIELDKVFDCLCSYELQKDFEIKTHGLYRHIKKVIPCFDVIKTVTELNSIQSLLTLKRMIVDNYSVLYLLTSFSSKEEQLLRYYLYLLDAINARPVLIDNFFSSTPVSLDNELLTNAMVTKASDEIASRIILEIIKEKKLDLLVDQSIIDKANWKFRENRKKNQKSNKYNWIELYSVARLPKRHADILQRYHSTFVHGLGISLIAENGKQTYPYILLTLDLCSIIMTLTMKIILNEYPVETKDLTLNKSIAYFMEDNWNSWK
jgi:hypothetical protein